MSRGPERGPELERAHGRRGRRSTAADETSPVRLGLDDGSAAAPPPVPAGSPWALAERGPRLALDEFAARNSWQNIERRSNVEAARRLHISPQNAAI